MSQNGIIHYESMFKHIIPALGEIPLRDLKWKQLQMLIDRMKSAGFSPQTVRHIRNVVSAVVTHAQRLEMFPGENPARLVKCPKLVHKGTGIMTLEQAVTITNRLRNPRDRALVIAATLTGMNIAELCGLQWRDVNLDSEKWAMTDHAGGIPPMHLAVRRQWIRAEYAGLKAESRERNMAITPMLEEVLRQLLAVGKFTGPTDPVFAARNGKPADEHNVMRRHIKPAALKLGLPGCGWHTFRRTFATYLDSGGVRAGVRRFLLGHSNESMTLRYIKQIPADVQTALKGMSDAMEAVNSDVPARVATEPPKAEVRKRPV